ncbi:MAG: flagellar biosynthesis anti-sigma factor FlgM [Desulfobacterium sp.]|nr:flagellar biosynthesis anti-sigma factor FlgM [Desulfobacterium sp.]
MENIRGLATGNYERQAYVQETVEKKRDIRENPPAELRNDSSEVKVSLSSGSKELQMAKNAAMSSFSDQNADRSEKVERIKQEVEEGRYKVNPENVAEKIVGLIVDEYV